MVVAGDGFTSNGVLLPQRVSVYPVLRHPQKAPLHCLHMNNCPLGTDFAVDTPVCNPPSPTTRCPSRERRREEARGPSVSMLKAFSGLYFLFLHLWYSFIQHFIEMPLVSPVCLCICVCVCLWRVQCPWLLTISNNGSWEQQWSRERKRGRQISLLSSPYCHCVATMRNQLNGSLHITQKSEGGSLIGCDKDMFQLGDNGECVKWHVTTDMALCCP